MTLRTTDEDDAALDALARAYGGVSKQQAALRAIRERAAELAQRSAVLALTDDVLTRYADALERLGEGPAGS